MKTKSNHSRRSFIGNTAILASSALLLPNTEIWANNTSNLQTVNDDLYVVGPKEGFTPHIGSLLSMMTMMRTWIKWGVKDLTVEQLDFQLDDKSNSIGAMLMHLAATEKYYQLNTFEEIPWGEWDESIKEEWNVASFLGKNARDKIKGHSIDYYFKKLDAVRDETIKTFKTLDDDWLMKSELFFPLGNGKRGQTNNYAKWFHVCEHESNHNGQIKFLKSRF